MNHMARVELALAYATVDAREGLRALLNLDAHMAETTTAAREPVFGQLRLAWWRDEIGRLGSAAGDARDPLLVALADHPELHGAALSIINGWEVRLADPDDFDGYARQRGGALFSAYGGDAWADVGTGWALVQLDPKRALKLLEGMKNLRASRELRPLAVLAYLCLRDLKRGAQGGPVRQIARALRFALIGA